MRPPRDQTVWSLRNFRCDRKSLIFCESKNRSFECVGHNSLCKASKVVIFRLLDMGTRSFKTIQKQSNSEYFQGMTPLRFGRLYHGPPLNRLSCIVPNAFSSKHNITRKYGTSKKYFGVAVATSRLHVDQHWSLAPILTYPKPHTLLVRNRNFIPDPEIRKFNSGFWFLGTHLWVSTLKNRRNHSDLQRNRCKWHKCILNAREEIKTNGEMCACFLEYAVWWILPSNFQHIFHQIVLCGLST
jgi:hypothetical protein